MAYYTAAHMGYALMALQTSAKPAGAMANICQTHAEAMGGVLANSNLTRTKVQLIKLKSCSANAELRSNLCRSNALPRLKLCWTAA